MNTVAVVDDFTDREAGLLVECERTIERGLKTFVEVGTALATIRDGRLYRTEYRSFEAYCVERWGFTDRRARQLMEAAEIGRILPVANAGQAAELARVPEEQRAEVWAEARERAFGRPTAAVIREVAEERKPAPSTPDPTFVLKYSAVAGWVIGPLGGAPFASADIDEMNVSGARKWAAAATLTIEGRVVLRWRESPDTDGAWIAVLDDVRPSAATSLVADGRDPRPAGEPDQPVTGSSARSDMPVLWSNAIALTDHDPATIAGVLDRTPGGWEHAAEARERLTAWFDRLFTHHTQERAADATATR